MRSVHKLGQMSAAQVMAAEGIVDEEVLEEVVQEHHETGERISDILLARGLVTEFDLAKAMVRHLQLPFVSPLTYDPPKDLRNLLPLSTLHHHRLYPMDRFGDLLVLVTCGDLDPSLPRQLEHETGCRITFYVAPISQIQHMLNQNYPMAGIGAQVANRLDELFGD